MNNGVVYQYRNTKDGKVYVGSTNNPVRRHQQHIRELRKGIHGNPRLQNAWNFHGESCFERSVLEEVPEPTREKLLAREQHYLDSLTHETSYNLAWVAGSCLGVKRSQETKQKLREANLGKVLSKEHKQSIAATKTGLKQTLEHTQNISTALTGVPFTKEHKKKLAEAQKNKKSVLKLSLEREVVAVFPSIREAARATGIVPSGIRTAINNPSRTAAEHYWTLLNENANN